MDNKTPLHIDTRWGDYVASANEVDESLEAASKDWLDSFQKRATIGRSIDPNDEVLSPYNHEHTQSPRILVPYIRAKYERSNTSENEVKPSPMNTTNFDTPKFVSPKCIGSLIAEKRDVYENGVSPKHTDCFTNKEPAVASTNRLSIVKQRLLDIENRSNSLNNTGKPPSSRPRESDESISIVKQRLRDFESRKSVSGKESQKIEPRMDVVANRRATFSGLSKGKPTEPTSRHQAPDNKPSRGIDVSYSCGVNESLIASREIAESMANFKPGSAVDFRIQISEAEIAAEAVRAAALGLKNDAEIITTVNQIATPSQVSGDRTRRWLPTPQETVSSGLASAASSTPMTRSKGVEMLANRIRPVDSNNPFEVTTTDDRVYVDVDVPLSRFSASEAESARVLARMAALGYVANDKIEQNEVAPATNVQNNRDYDYAHEGRQEDKSLTKSSVGSEYNNLATAEHGEELRVECVEPQAIDNSNSSPTDDVGISQADATVAQRGDIGLNDQECKCNIQDLIPSSADLSQINMNSVIANENDPVMNSIDSANAILTSNESATPSPSLNNSSVACDLSTPVRKTPKSMVRERLREIERRLSGQFDDSSSAQDGMRTPVAVTAGSALVSPRVQAIERNLSGSKDKLTPNSATAKRSFSFQVKKPLAEQVTEEVKRKTEPRLASASAATATKKDSVTKELDDVKAREEASTDVMLSNELNDQSLVQVAPWALERRPSNREDYCLTPSANEEVGKIGSAEEEAEVTAALWSLEMKLSNPKRYTTSVDSASTTAVLNSLQVPEVLVGDEEGEHVVTAALWSLERRLSTRSFSEHATAPERPGITRSGNSANTTKEFTESDNEMESGNLNDNDDEHAVSSALWSLERRLSRSISDRPSSSAVVAVAPAVNAQSDSIVVPDDKVEHDVVVSAALWSLERKLKKSTSESSAHSAMDVVRSAEEISKDRNQDKDNDNDGVISAALGALASKRRTNEVERQETNKSVQEQTRESPEKMTAAEKSNIETTRIVEVTEIPSTSSNGLATSIAMFPVNTSTPAVDQTLVPKPASTVVHCNGCGTASPITAKFCCGCGMGINTTVPKYKTKLTSSVLEKFNAQYSQSPNAPSSSMTRRRSGNKAKKASLGGDIIADEVSTFAQVGDPTAPGIDDSFGTFSEQDTNANETSQSVPLEHYMDKDFMSNMDLMKAFETSCNFSTVWQRVADITSPFSSSSSAKGFTPERQAQQPETSNLASSSSTSSAFAAYGSGSGISSGVSNRMSTSSDSLSASDTPSRVSLKIYSAPQTSLAIKSADKNKRGISSNSFGRLSAGTPGHYHELSAPNKSSSIDSVDLSTRSAAVYPANHYSVEHRRNSRSVAFAPNC